MMKSSTERRRISSSRDPFEQRAEALFVIEPAGKIIMDVSLLIQNGDDQTVIIVRNGRILHEITGGENRQVGGLDQLAEGLKIVLQQKMRIGDLIDAKLIPEADLTEQEDVHALQLFQPDAFAIGQRMILRENDIQLFLSVRHPIQCFIVGLPVKNDQLECAVMQAVQQRRIRVNLLGYRHILIERGDLRHKLLYRYRRTAADADGMVLPIKGAYPTDDLAILLQ